MSRSGATSFGTSLIVYQPCLTASTRSSPMKRPEDSASLSRTATRCPGILIATGFTIHPK